MNTKISTTLTAALVLLLTLGLSPHIRALQVDDDDPVGYDENYRYDRFLNVEVWTNHSDGDYYIGDNVLINFRVNRDAFVAIYSIDSRGRVNMLFPYDPGMDNFVNGGVTYTIPGPDDGFDLVISGPEGVENIQAIASREPIALPDWFPESGLYCDWDDRHDYMDYLNSKYFVRYGGQRLSFDRSAIYVNEWERHYFRPIYRPVYPSWTLYGNVYIDYPFGRTVYIDGVYWGVTPLYIPRMYVGWHTITVYDHWGYCWEHDFHSTRYHTVVLDHRIIRPRPNVRSKYKDIHVVGYRDPVKHGYPKYHDRKTKILSSPKVTRGSVSGKVTVTKSTQTTFTAEKKYVRGTPKLVETKRGYESAGIGNKKSDTRIGTQKRVTSSSKARTTKSASYDKAKSRSGKRSVTSGKSYYDSKSTTGSSSKKSYQGSSGSSGSSGKSGSYRKKSGSSYEPKGKSSKVGSSKKGSSKSGNKKATVKKSPPPKKSGSAGKSQPKIKKSTPKSKPSSSSGKSGDSKSSGGKSGKKSKRR